ncbi:transcription termination factor [Catenovulum agarivorans DS-2]|uniref:Transcription antitermination protein NusB n=1 Tax=Catenovulum agarivorans DS-2 TaxID=1328313 RepID=W7QZJ4_9ALTE|nr:transcription antitermination factor NusB [Catenovulum agarivorans]EWH10780.1 transcription termination factor [Catenovulum agarivorans DS-2]
MKPSHRRRSRELATQSIYSWQASGNRPANIIESTMEEVDVKSFDVNFYRSLVTGTANNAKDLDIAFQDHLDRPLDELDMVELAILRVATYELVHCVDVPYKVVINEAIEIAKTFAAEDSHKFINGVLDKAVKKLRPFGK